MLLLASTSDKIRLTTGSATNIDVHASWVDGVSSVTPGRTNTPITTATTTDIVGAPGSSTYRTVKTITIRNRDASTSNAVTVIHTDGTNAMELYKCTLFAGYTLHYHEGAGFWVTDNYGGNVFKEQTNGIPAATNSTNLVALGSDVTNNNGTANTIADVTGLSFSVTAAQTYYFRFQIDYTAAATTTGNRWYNKGPGSQTRL